MKNLTLAFTLITFTFFIKPILASVKHKELRGGKLRVTFTQEDISKFQLLEELIFYSGNKIPSRCFDRTIEDDFGAPTKERVCSIVFTKGKNIDLQSSNGYFKITDANLTKEMQQYLSRFNQVKVAVNRSEYLELSGTHGGTASAGSQGFRGITFLPLYRAIASISDDLGQGNFFCVDQSLWKKFYNAPDLEGCFILGQEFARPKIENAYQLVIKK